MRCQAREPPLEAEQRIGALTFRMRERVLEITGLRRPAVIAAFSGPGPGRAPDQVMLGLLAADAPQLMFVLGDLGDDDAVAKATVKALAGLAIPVLLVAGARDTPARLTAAVAAASDGRVLDVSGLDGVRIGDDTFVPLPGAYLGRYGLAGRGCGYGSDELAALEQALGARKSGRRWLLSWQAPEPGAEERAAEPARFGAAIGAAGGLYAWPTSNAGRAFGGAQHSPVPVNAPARSDLQLVVPRLTAPALERADGTRSLPGYALLRLDTAGLQLLAVRQGP